MNTLGRDVKEYLNTHQSVNGLLKLRNVFVENFIEICM